MYNPKENIHHQPRDVSKVRDTEIIDQELEEQPNLNSSATSHQIMTNDNNMMQLLHADEKHSSSSRRYMPVLIINFLSLFVGSISSSLLSKYCFIHRGSSRWVSTWVQSAGSPLLIIPIYLPYFLKFTKRRPFSSFNRRITILSIFVGFTLGSDNLLFSWGNSYLSVSTSTLLLYSQIAFNLVFSVITVKQKITFLNPNSMILLILREILLAFDPSHEKSHGLTKANYFIGYFCTFILLGSN